MESKTVFFLFVAHFEWFLAPKLGEKQYPEAWLPHTPLKTNMSPENRWLEDVFPTEMVTF